MRKAKWCKFCGRKRVIYSPDFYRDKKPYKCLECESKHSNADLGIKKNIHNGSSNYKPEHPEKLRLLCKLLRKGTVDNRRVEYE